MKTLTFVLLFFLVLSGIFIYLIWRGKRNTRNAQIEKSYEAKYKKIDKVIENYSVCDQNYDYINVLLDHLSELKYRNKEKTIVLRDKFNVKYEGIKQERDKLK
jgi:uncharacterized membrane protein